MNASDGFGTRLARVFGRAGRLCVGIDPHAWLLEAWGLPDSADGAERMARTVVAACAGAAGIVKPQIAYFERFGAAGYTALERTLADARDAGLLVIGDVKRGDIGSTMDAYAAAWLTPGAPLEVDAITLSPYLGVGALNGTLRTAVAAGKGAFVLAATSNPEARALQRADAPGSDARRAGRGAPVARMILEEVLEFDRTAPAAPIDPVGVVIGATLTLADFGLDDVPEAPGRVLPVLAPGFGHQGAPVGDIERIYGALAAGVIVSESRSILSAGPDRLAAVISAHAAEAGHPDV